MSGKFALIIGNTDYVDSGLVQLAAPSRDAQDFARILKDPEVCAFDQVDILMNQFSSTLIEAIDEFFDEKKPDDLLVLYFSGHGVRDEFGSLYLAVKNTIRSRLRSTAIKADYIREAMDQSRSKRQVVVVDCCNSGAFPQGTKAEIGGTMGMVSALQGYGRFVLTASDATQFAWEGNKVVGDMQNSLFTHFLVKGLEGDADNDGDGAITVDDLYDYTYEQIAKLTPKQTPTKSASKQEGEIVLRQIRRIEDIRPVPLPAPLLDSIENPFADIRLGAVQQLGKLLSSKNLGLTRSAREALERIVAKDDSRIVSQAAKEVLASFPRVELKVQTERLSHENMASEKAEYKTVKQTVSQQAEHENVRREAIEKPESKAKETREITEKRGQTSSTLLSKALDIIKIHYRRIFLFGIAVTLMMASLSIPFLGLFTPTATPTPSRVPTATVTALSTLSTAQPSKVEEPECQTPTASVKANHAYLREGPDVRFPGSAQYKKGDQFAVLGQYKEWFRVEASDGKRGWLYEDWLTMMPGIGAGNVCVIPENEVPAVPQDVQTIPRTGVECTPTYYGSCP